MSYQIGLDIGSTTIKVVVLNESGQIIYKSYERHLSKVRAMTLEKFKSLQPVLEGHDLKIAVTGSAGLGLAKEANLSFVQEVFATAGAVKRYEPQTDVVIELGGEDAKIIFLQGSLEERMNSTCAGGTGAFIDQMASLLNVDLQTLDTLSLNYDKIYPIASRCGVFAKTDIQPLINQGAAKENIAASIFQAVVDQTIAGLAQGRPISGNVLFLGGPLSFLKGLQKRFTQTLGLSEQNAIFPALAQYYIALGAALYCANDTVIYDYESLVELLTRVASIKQKPQGLPPLFATKQEYEDFIHRHEQTRVDTADLTTYHGKAYLGVDAGSTTTKTVLLDENCRILYQDYVGNLGNPIDAVKRQLGEIYAACQENLQICGFAVTGYGEDLIQNAFHADFGLVETIAHFTAAKHFEPKVDFIIDIGGQDMKCFKIRNHSIDGILLNEACSSGCGSFIETFAKSLGYEIEEFAEMGLFAEHPVDLGSRCTVFMNSSVKQAQKTGATVEDISAGLAASVVKNALYKVIRAKSAQDIGEHIIVQGGTFLNNAVLRCFEKELGVCVIRPEISGLMGAFGAALYAKQHAHNISSILSPEELQAFTHSSKAVTCQGCTNHCNLTINTFSDGKKFIAGNRCERPVTGTSNSAQLPDMIAFKYDRLISLMQNSRKGPRGKIGLPLVLNMYENLPFWHAFFTPLGFEVILSGRSSKELYLKGQNTIPSDTVCYPAKLVHGHIKALIEQGVHTIFHPCMSYNFDERISDNCYNCPVVAYYPELIHANVDFDSKVRYLYPYITMNNRDFFEKYMLDCLNTAGFSVTEEEMHHAADTAYRAYDEYKSENLIAAQHALSYAQQNGCKTLVVAGRPYHIDPEINHGINKLLTTLGFVVVTADCIAQMVQGTKESNNVLNQWTYHARMYHAAHQIAQMPNTELVQLVSFGCGLDAITTDEIRDILQGSGKLYTQIKIDEIDNLGAAKIRIRSLLAAMEERGI